MRKIKEIIEITTIEDEKINKNIRVLEHTIRSWEELTREEKEEQIDKHSQTIYEMYQEDMYIIYKEELEMLKQDFPHIKFEDIYLDSTSQGWWIDRIKDFRYEVDDLIVFNERVGINDVDFKIRRLIEDFDLDIWTYYIDSETLSKIEKTKKYQNWVKKIEEDLQKWVDRVNIICTSMGDAEWNCPYNLDNVDDRDYLDNYFSDIEFTDTKALEE